MPSPEGVKVALDRDRILRYTNRAIVMLEDESGLTVQGLMDRVTAGSLKAVNQLIWAGLLHDEPDLALIDVYDMVDISRLGAIADAVSAAVESAFGAPEESDEGKAPAATDSS